MNGISHTYRWHPKMRFYVEQYVGTHTTEGQNCFSRDGNDYLNLFLAPINQNLVEVDDFLSAMTITYDADITPADWAKLLENLMRRNGRHHMTARQFYSFINTIEVCCHQTPFSNYQLKKGLTTVECFWEYLSISLKTGVTVTSVISFTRRATLNYYLWLISEQQGVVCLTPHVVTLPLTGGVIRTCL